jgi:MSHA biogenesis protein MshP
MTNFDNQRGIALVSAIFLLVVLSALGTVMVSLSGTSHFTMLYALQGAKGASNTFTVNTADTPFSVTVSCGQTTHTEKGATYNIYSLTATAETQGAALGTPVYAARRITATVTDAL